MKYGYDEALKKVLAIRTQRRKIYEDNWKNETDWVLLAMIKQKVGRLEHFIIKKPSDNTYENKIDTLIDLANYTLFLLENEIQTQRQMTLKEFTRK